MALAHVSITERIAACSFVFVLVAVISLSFLPVPMVQFAGFCPFIDTTNEGAVSGHIFWP
jgi:hypothetical protein